MLRQIAVAFGFLTRLPVPDVTTGGRPPVDDADLRRATAWFWLVGLVVGGIGALVRWGLDVHLGATTSSALAVAATALATGAFHEDGWADTFDGLWGGWTPEARIAIMRDSRVGTYGALALLLAVLVQVTALARLSPTEGALALVGAHVLARQAVLLLIAVGEPATDQGSGARVAEPLGPVAFAAATAAGLGTAAAALTAVGGAVGLVATLVALAVVVLGTRAVARRRIGGTTGDVLGATAVATTITTLLVASAFGGPSA